MAERGRPRVMTEEQKQAVCDWLSGGGSLRKLAEADPSMVDLTTIFRELSTDNDFYQRYSRAREAQMEMMAEDIIEISDNAERDILPGPNGPVVNYEHIARSKLRVDSRKWLMSKLAPKRYGDKLVQEITGKDGGAVEIAASSVSNLDRAKALAALVAKTKGDKPAEGGDQSGD